MAAAVRSPRRRPAPRRRCPFRLSRGSRARSGPPRGRSVTRMAAGSVRAVSASAFRTAGHDCGGGRWSTRMATRYNATQDGELVYRAVQFAHVVWGRLAEETIQPDTQMVAAALDRGEVRE